MPNDILIAIHFLQVFQRRFESAASKLGITALAGLCHKSGRKEKRRNSK